MERILLGKTSGKEGPSMTVCVCGGGGGGGLNPPCPLVPPALLGLT